MVNTWDERLGPEPDPAVLDKIATVASSVVLPETLPGHNATYVAGLLGDESLKSRLSPELGVQIGTLAAAAHLAATYKHLSAESRVPHRVIHFSAGTPTADIARDEGCSPTQVNQAKQKVATYVRARDLGAKLREIFDGMQPTADISSADATVPTDEPSVPKKTPAQRYEEQPNEWVDAVSLEVTDDEQEALDRWVSHTKGMPAEREVELGFRVQAGDKDAMDEFVLGNLGLVKYIVNLHFGSRELPVDMKLDDLYSIGVIPLMTAVQKFNPNLGIKFSTYAYPTIKGYVTRVVNKQGSGLSGTFRARATITSAARTYDELELTLGSNEALLETSRRYGVDRDELSILLRASRAIVGNYVLISASRGDQQGWEREPVAVPEESIAEAVDFLRSHSLLAGLDEAQFQAYCLRHGLADGVERDNDEVAAIMGVHPNQVKAYLKRARQKINKNKQSYDGTNQDDI